MTSDELALCVAHAMLKKEGSGPSWGIEILEVREGFARLAMRVRADMLNGHGSIHGGMIFALADTAFAYACNSRNIASVAQGASIVFLAPANAGEILVAEAREDALRGRSGVYSVRVTTGADNRVVAQFQGQSRAIGGPAVETFEIINPEHQDT